MHQSFRSALLYGLLAAAMVGSIAYCYHLFSEEVRPPNQPSNADIIHVEMPQPAAMTNTKTGLLLAGLTAQKRRDWGEAWQNFSSLNNRFLDNPDIALRAFTLALGNGDFDEALAIATPMTGDLFGGDTQILTEAAQYDLMRLFIILNLIRSEDYQTANAYIDDLDDSAIIEFSKPILKLWTQTEEFLKTFDLKTTTLNTLQLYHIALALESLNKPDLSGRIFDKIIKGPGHPEKIIAIAYFYNRQNQSDKAMEILVDAKLKFPDLKDIGQAIIRLQNGYPNSSAHHEYDDHLKGIHYALSMAYHDFAKLLLGDRAIDSGLLFARMASFLNPEDKSLYMTIGDILTYQNQSQSALSAYEEIEPGHPDFERAIVEQVDLLEQNEEYDQAFSLIEKAIESIQPNENAYFYYLKGNILKALDQYEDALNYYNEAERLALADTTDGQVIDSKFWPLYYSRAVAYDLLDQWEKSEKDMMIALEKYPDNPIILNYLGYGYADRNINLEKSLDMLSRAVIAAPNDPYIIDSMGWVLFRTGDYDRAVYYLERAAKINPYHMVINDHLGDAYWHVGRKIEAYYMWQRAADYYDDTNEEQQRMIDETRRKLKEGYEVRE